MLTLARASIRRPRHALTVWILIAGVLIAIGFGVTSRLAPTNTLVKGTEAARAQRLANAHFGPSQLVPILLVGPKQQLDKQGPALVRRLAARSDTRVLSAWDAGSTGRSLRPKPTEAMIVASVAKTEQQLIDGVQAQIDRTVYRSTSGAVHAHITGQATLDRAIKNESVDTTRTAFLIGLPIMFLVLLVVLRAPLAALIVTIFGGVTAFAGIGVMSLVARVFNTDGIGLALCSLMGLALGSGLALLILSRFHREEAEVTGPAPEAALAASTAVMTAGRAVLVAGTGLVVSMVVASAVGPTENLNSIGTGAVINTLLATGAAVVVMPAVLTILGLRTFAGAFGAPRFLAAPWRRLVGAEHTVLSRAALAGGASLLFLGALAVPALSLKTGPPDPRFLASDSTARKDFAAVQKAMGPGWPTPFNIVVASKANPITQRKTLIAFDRFETSLIKDPRVDSVTGPGAFQEKTASLGTLNTQLNKSKKLLKNGPRNLAKLENGLGQAGAGAVELQSGLQSAATGAGKLSAGGSRAEAGAGQLHSGLGLAQAGSAKIQSGLQDAAAGADKLTAGAGQALAGAEKLTGGAGQALAGATKLAGGSGAALKGAQQLTSGLQQAAGPVKQGLPLVEAMAADAQKGSTAVTGATNTAKTLTGQIAAAQSALQSMTTGKQDPRYQAAVASLNQAGATAGSLSSSLNSAQGTVAATAAIAGPFAGQVVKLSGGLDQLYAGSQDLQAGIGRLSSGNAALAKGLSDLRSGNAALTGGIGQLKAGAGKLGSGLKSGAPQVGQLTSGLTQLRDGAAQLQLGLAALSGGAGQLQGGLAGGVPKVGELASGLGIMRTGVAKFRTQLPSARDLERLQAQSPGLFDSGYFVLAAVQGAPPAARNQASFAVNLTRGGTAGQIVVVPKQPASSSSTQDLANDLTTRTAAFAKKINAQAAVGGPAGQLANFQDTVGGDIQKVVLALAIVVALVLLVALRSVPLALVTVAINLLVAAAAFGVAALLTRGSSPVLGGPGFIDPEQVIETFSAVFGIALIYEVILLQRTRERFMRSGRPREALGSALQDTAASATGAAAVMVAAVIPFVFSGLFNLRLTIALAVAILLDAFVVRPVLLPAVMALLGRRAWWPSVRWSPPPAPPDAGGPVTEPARVPVRTAN